MIYICSTEARQQEAHLQQEVQHRQEEPATQAGETAVQAEGTQSGEQEGEQSNQLTPEEQRKADYKKFKDSTRICTEMMIKKQVDRRFAPMNRMQQQLDSQGRLMQVIAAKYGTDASDVDGMINAINADSAYYEEKALEAGMPVEKYKEFMNLQAKNKAMEEAQRRAENLRQGGADLGALGCGNRAVQEPLS